MSTSEAGPEKTCVICWKKKPLGEMVITDEGKPGVVCERCAGDVAAAAAEFGEGL